MNEQFQSFIWKGVLPALKISDGDTPLDSFCFDSRLMIPFYIKLEVQKNIFLTVAFKPLLYEKSFLDH